MYTVHAVWRSFFSFCFAGASASIENSEGETPLVIAEYAKHDDVVKLLSEAIEDAGSPFSTQPSEGLGIHVHAIYELVTACLSVSKESFCIYWPSKYLLITCLPSLPTYLPACLPTSVGLKLHEQLFIVTTSTFVVLVTFVHNDKFFI